MNFILNVKKQMMHFFFVNKHCNNLVKMNLQILLMNCIYKMNCYKLSLMIISEVMSFNITFYVTFCFFIVEKKNYI